MNNIQNKDLFSTVHIETNKVWTVLMWLDSVNNLNNIIKNNFYLKKKANFGGIKYVNNEEDEENKV